MTGFDNLYFASERVKWQNEN